MAKLVIEESPAELKFFSDSRLCYITTSTVATLGFLDCFQKDMDMKYSFFKKMQETEKRI